MFIAYVIIAPVLALMLLASAAFKLRRDPRVVGSIHEIVGVPLRYFPHLAALEIAGRGLALLSVVVIRERDS
jgi:hypothetical protein